MTLKTCGWLAEVSKDYKAIIEVSSKKQDKEY